MTESVLLTAVMEVHEGHTVYTADILRAFMQGEQDEFIHMVLWGP